MTRQYQTRLTIAVDFDGTCVEHKYPEVGATIPGAVECLREIIDAGHMIIIFTMRDGEFLQAAVDWYKMNDLRWWGVNENPDQYNWTQSGKIYANIYIDDAALGCPLINPDGLGRPFVDWDAVRHQLKEKRII